MTDKPSITIILYRFRPKIQKCVALEPIDFTNGVGIKSPHILAFATAIVCKLVA